MCDKNKNFHFTNVYTGVQTHFQISTGQLINSSAPIRFQIAFR